MPWTAADAPSHSHHANTPAKRHKWATVANNALKEYDGDEGRAIRVANAAVKPKKKALTVSPALKALADAIRFIKSDRYRDFLRSHVKK